MVFKNKTTKSKMFNLQNSRSSRDDIWASMVVFLFRVGDSCELRRGGHERCLERRTQHSRLTDEEAFLHAHVNADLSQQALNVVHC